MAKTVEYGLMGDDETIYRIVRSGNQIESFSEYEPWERHMLPNEIFDALGIIRPSEI